MNSTKKVTIAINSLNTSNTEDCKKINLIKSICKYYDYKYNICINENDIAHICIQCCSDDEKKLINIFLSFDICVFC